MPTNVNKNQLNPSVVFGGQFHVTIHTTHDGHTIELAAGTLVHQFTFDKSKFQNISSIRLEVVVWNTSSNAWVIGLRNDTDAANLATTISIAASTTPTRYISADIKADFASAEKLYRLITISSTGGTPIVSQARLIINVN